MKGGEGGQVGKGCLGGKVKFYERRLDIHCKQSLIPLFLM